MQLRAWRVECPELQVDGERTRRLMGALTMDGAIRTWLSHLTDEQRARLRPGMKVYAEDPKTGVWEATLMSEVVWAVAGVRRVEP